MSRRSVFNTGLLIGISILLFGGLVWAQSGAVPFTGNVKKVIPARHKVAIKDPETKKRFTVVVDGKTRLTGFSAIEELKKGDPVSGSYVVTKDGKYLAGELSRK